MLMIPERLLDGPARTFANQCRRVMYAASFGKVPLGIPRGCGSAALDAQLWSSGGIQYVPYPIYVYLSNGDRAPESKFSGKT